MELLRDYNLHQSEEAFSALVQRHVNLVYSVALRYVGIAANAEEITQVVFIVLARKAGSLRPDSILEGWLHETTRLTSLRFLRGERRRQLREQEVYMQTTLQETSAASVWNQLAPLLDEALARLKNVDRDAVMLRFFRNKDLREVAAELGVNEAAAQKRVHRAIEKLRLFFSKRGIVFSASVLTAAISGNSVQAAPAALAKTTTALALAKGTLSSASTLTLINGTLKLMALTKANTAIIVVAIAALAGIGVYEAHEASILKTQIRSLQQERSEATKQLSALRDQNGQLSERQMALQKTVQELQRVTSVPPELDPQAAAAAAREKAEKAKITALADGQDFLASYSEARTMLTEIGKAQIGRNYAAFYRMAGLSASQIEEFEKQTNARWMAAIVVTRPSSVHPDQPELTDEQARNVLGEKAFEQFQLFKRLRPVQGIVHDMSSLSPNAPLTQDQTVQVLGILANASSSFQSGGKADPKTIDWSQVEAQAQGVLTKPQIAALRAESKLPQVGQLIKEYYRNQPPAK